MSKIWPLFAKKTPFILCFDLISTLNFFDMLFFIWNIFSQILFQYFRLSYLPMWPIFNHFRGSCCVKITKNSPKSTFLEPFDLILSGNIFYLLFSYEIRIDDCFLMFFLSTWPIWPIFGPFQGSYCVKMAKNDSKSGSRTCFDTMMFEIVFAKLITYVYPRIWIILREQYNFWKLIIFEVEI